MNVNFWINLKKNFIFQPQTIHHISDIKYLTIIDVVDYVDKQIQMRDQVIK